MKKDIAEMKRDIVVMKEDIKTMKREIKVLQAEQYDTQDIIGTLVKYTGRRA